MGFGSKPMIGPFDEVLKDIKVGTATQDVDITGLDLVNHEAYKIFIKIINDTSSDYDLNLYFNGNYTDTDYIGVATRLIYGVDLLNGGVSKVDHDEPYIVLVGDGTSFETILTVGLSQIGTEYMAGYQVRRVGIPSGTDDIADCLVTGRTKFLASNFTELRFHSDVADGIGAGSRIRIMPFTPEYSL